MTSRNSPSGAGEIVRRTRLRHGLSAAGRGWDRDGAGAALVVRAIGRDLVTGLALAGAGSFDPGWPRPGTEGGSGALRAMPQGRIDRT